MLDGFVCLLALALPFLFLLRGEKGVGEKGVRTIIGNLGKYK